MSSYHTQAFSAPPSLSQVNRLFFLFYIFQVSYLPYENIQDSPLHIKFTQRDSGKTQKIALNSLLVFFLTNIQVFKIKSKIIFWNDTWLLYAATRKCIGRVFLSDLAFLEMGHPSSSELRKVRNNFLNLKKKTYQFSSIAHWSVKRR